MRSIDRITHSIMVVYLKFADVGIFLQRYGKEVCGYSGPGIADHSPAFVHYQDWRHLFFHLCLDFCTSHISGKSHQVLSIMPYCIIIIICVLRVFTFKRCVAIW